jgi:phosphonate transport system substrate-binding protein
MLRSDTPFRIGATVPVERAGRASLFEVSPTAVALIRLCAELAQALEIEVEPRSFDGYAELLRAIDAGQIELAWLPPIPALHAIAAGRIRPLALPVRAGATTFGSALFAREDGRVKNLVDLVGTTAAWVDQHSAAGYVVIRAALRARGIDLRAAFTEELFLGSHAAVVEAVLGGDVEVGATHVHFSPDGAGLSRGGWGEQRVRVLALAGPIPGDMLACAAHLDESLRSALAGALLGVHPGVQLAAQALLDADAIVPARAEHLEALGSLAMHVGEESDSTLPPPL